MENFINKLKQNFIIRSFVQFVNKLSEHKNVSLCVYAFTLGMLNFLRMFDNSVWGDEGLVVIACRLSFADLISYVILNGHTPFHYVVAWSFVKVFGESGFVYHLSATLPYFIILLLSVTIIKKWFGIKTSFIFITFCSLLKCSTILNLEIRVYAWCSLFCLISFLFAYKIYFTHKFKYFVLLGIFASLAAYAHYFSLASIGLIYFGILLKIAFQYKFSKYYEYIKFFVASGTFLVLFIPWIIYVKHVKQEVISDYHIAEASWSSCFNFIFSSAPKFTSIFLFFLWLTIPIVYYCKKFNLFNLTKSSDSVLSINFCYNNLSFKCNCSRYIYWLLTGYFAVLGTIIASQMFSIIFFPITIDRYLYVCFIIAWLILAIELSSICKSKYVFAAVLTTIILLLSPYYVKTSYTEYNNNSLLSKTLSKTKSIITKKDFIYTDIVHFAWTVSESYFPKIPHQLFGHEEWWGPIELPHLDEQTTYYLFLSQPITQSIQNNLKLQNRSADLIVDNGYIGTGAVWVYYVPASNND